MKEDWSKDFYERYSRLDNPAVTITLVNGKKSNGVLISYALGNEDLGDSYISRWQLVPEQHKLTTGCDAFGFLIGEYILQKDILRIEIHE